MEVKVKYIFVKTLMWFLTINKGADFEGFVAVATVDYGTFHIYTQDWGKDVSWGQTWITDHVNAANAAGILLLFYIAVTILLDI